MPWHDDKFYYTSGLLRAIAENYTVLYDGLPRWYGELMNPWELAEYKADFDQARSSLNRNYQQVVNAALSGRRTDELALTTSFALMRKYLNGRTVINHGGGDV